MRCLHDCKVKLGDFETGTEGCAERFLSFDHILPQSTRGALLATYLIGVPWNFLSKAQADGTCHSVAARAAARFCKSEEAVSIASSCNSFGQDRDSFQVLQYAFPLKSHFRG